MTHPLPDVVVAASRLRAAIEEAAAALGGADLDRLLASDALLQKVLTQIPRPASIPAAARPLLRQEIEDARSALRRCRRLGASLNDFARFTREAQGDSGYHPTQIPAAALNGRAFNQKA